MPDSFTETELDTVLERDTDDTEDLSATIAAALKADAKPEEDAPAEAAPEGDVKGDDETEQTDTEEHAQESASSTDEEEVAASDETDGDKSDDEDTGTEQAKPVIEPPAMFTEADKETFRALPPEAQDIVARRETERNADYDRKSKDIVERSKAVDAFQAAVQPYQPYFASLGTTPEQAFHVLLATEYKLRMGAPDEKLKVFAQLAKTYGIDPVDLSDVSEADPVSPEIAQTNNRLAEIERRIATDHREAAGQLQGNAETQIEAFADEKDADGNPAHPHLEAVATIMGQLMQANPELDMATAYVNATYADPTIRTQVLAKEREQADAEAKRAQDKADKARAKKAKEAKKAAVGVKAVSEPSGKAADEELDLRAQIAKEFELASASP